MYEQDEQMIPPKRKYITCFHIGFIIIACLFMAGVVIWVLVN
jgi:hypothetical protein